MADPSTLFGIEGAFIPMYEVKGAFDLHLAVFCEEWREKRKSELKAMEEEKKEETIFREINWIEKRTHIYLHI